MSIRRNTLLNLAGTALPLLLGLVTIPYLIENAGVETFGILTLVWALIGYFSLFDFGLGRALTQQVAAGRASGNASGLPGLVKSGIWFTAVTGLIGGLALGALAHELATQWLKVSEPLQSSTLIALLIAAIGIPLTTITAGLRGILEAYEDFGVVNLLRAILGLANFGLPALSVMYVGDSLVWMVAGLIAARLAMLVLHAWFVRQRLRSIWRPAAVSKADIKNLLSFGAWMTVSNIVSPLMVTADRFIISAMLGASLVAYYTVPYEALSRVLIIPTALATALFPRLASVIKRNPFEFARLYRKALVRIAQAMLPICLLIMLGSKAGLALWIGQEFAERSWLIVCVMATGLFFNGVAFVPFALIQAAGDARMTARLHLLELAIYIPFLFVSITLFGLIGAAFAWSARTVIDAALLMWAARKHLTECE